MTLSLLLNDSLLIFILGFLILAVAFNLWLTFRLIHAFRFLPTTNDNTSQKLSEGMLISDFSMNRVIDKKKISLQEYHGYAKVLVFLNSKCGECKSKLSELSKSVEMTKGLGVLILILSIESKKRMKRFLHDDTLLNITMRTSKSIFNYLNQDGASPYYLFIDSENVLQAQGFIGDRHWSDFIKQLEQEN